MHSMDPVKAVGLAGCAERAAVRSTAPLRGALLRALDAPAPLHGNVVLAAIATDIRGGVGAG